MYSTVQYCTVVDMMHVTVCMMGSTEISERLCHIMCATVLLYLGYTKVLHASHPCMAEINSYQHRNEIATGLVMSVSFMSYSVFTHNSSYFTRYIAANHRHRIQ